MCYWRSWILRGERENVEKIATDEDLTSIMTEWAASYSCQNKITPVLEDKRLQLVAREEERSRKVMKWFAEASSFNITLCKTKKEDDDYAIEINPKRLHKRTVKTRTTVFIPRDVLKFPEQVSTTTRNKIAPTAMSSKWNIEIGMHFLLTLLFPNPTTACIILIFLYKKNQRQITWHYVWTTLRQHKDDTKGS